MILEDRNILVCGATGLIGKAVVEQCVKEGATVTGISRSASSDSIDLSSASLVPLEVCLDTEKEFQELIDKADPSFDGLVNCMGFWWGPEALAEMDNVDIERHISSSVEGPLLVYKTLSRFLETMDSLFSFVQVNGVGGAKDIPGSTAVAAGDAYINRLFTNEAVNHAFKKIKMVQLAIHGTVSRTGEGANFSAKQIGKAIAYLLSHKTGVDRHGRTEVLSHSFQLVQFEPPTKENDNTVKKPRLNA